MNNDRGLAYLATGAVFLGLIAFMVSTIYNGAESMAAYKTEKDIRVVCYLPDETNRKLQAYASLEGISKQELTARILVEWVHNSEDKITRKAPAKKAAKETTQTE